MREIIYRIQRILNIKRWMKEKRKKESKIPWVITDYPSWKPLNCPRCKRPNFVLHCISSNSICCYHCGFIVKKEDGYIHPVLNCNNCHKPLDQITTIPYDYKIKGGYKVTCLKCGFVFIQKDLWIK